MPLNEIPANSMAVLLNKDIINGRELAVKVTKTSSTTKSYKMSIEFEFDASIVTGNQPIAANGDYVKFGNAPNTISSINNAVVYFRALEETILLEVKNTQTFSTNGVKVRSGGSPVSFDLLVGAIQNLSEQELERVKALLR